MIFFVHIFKSKKYASEVITGNHYFHIQVINYILKYYRKIRNQS